MSQPYPQYPAQPQVQPAYPYPQSQPSAPAYPQPGVFPPPPPPMLPHPAGGGYIPQPYGAPQGYPQQVPVPQGPPPAAGSLDAFNTQPGSGYGNSVSWKGKPDGASISGIIARDVNDSDVRQDSDPQTGQLKTYRDGRPKFALSIPLDVAMSQDYPEGRATLWVRGALRDALNQAMQAAGRTGGKPLGGDAVTVILTGRKPSRGGIPANAFRVGYMTPDGGEGWGGEAGAPVAQAPQPQWQPQQYGQQVPNPPQAQQQYAQPEMIPAYQAPSAPAPASQPVPQAPVQPQPSEIPPGGAPMDDARLALMAKLTGQAQG